MGVKGLPFHGSDLCALWQGGGDHRQCLDMHRIGRVAGAIPLHPQGAIVGKAVQRHQPGNQVKGLDRIHAGQVHDAPCACRRRESGVVSVDHQNLVAMP